MSLPYYEMLLVDVNMAKIQIRAILDELGKKIPLLPHLSFLSLHFTLKALHRFVR